MLRDVQQPLKAGKQKRKHVFRLFRRLFRLPIEEHVVGQDKEVYFLHEEP